MLDGQTVYIVGFVSQAVFALTLALLAIVDRSTEGTRWFAAGCCLELLTSASRALLQSEQAELTVSAGSCLLVLVFYFVYMGLRWFAVRRPLQTWKGPVFTTLSMVVVLLLSLHSIPMGLIASRIAALVVMGMTLPMLFRPRIKALALMTRTTGATILLMMFTVLARTIAERAVSTATQARADNFAKLATMLLATALSFCFVGLFVAESQRRLHEETRIDVLTGLSNRRAMEEALTASVRAAARLGHPLSLLVLDIDQFKKVNDTWGHAVGDRALQALGRLLNEVCGSGECVARLGGEEFAMMLPRMGAEKAAALAEVIRASLEHVHIREGEATASITVSIGVSSLAVGEAGWFDMLRRADKALYRAKHDGRNRVCVWSEADYARGAQYDSKLLHWRRPFVSDADVTPSKKRAETAG